MNKVQAIALSCKVIWGLFLIGIASSYLRDVVHIFFGMTHITYWDASDVILLIYSIKLLLREAK